MSSLVKMIDVVGRQLPLSIRALHGTFPYSTAIHYDIDTRAIYDLYEVDRFVFWRSSIMSGHLRGERSAPAKLPCRIRNGR